MSANYPRARRNNNPGNIRIGDPWQGLCPREDMTVAQAAETEFCVFKAPRWGFRAMAVTLISYQDKRGLRTVARIIRRWAPPEENDTAAYISAVLRDTGFTPDQALDLHNYETMAPLVRAIAKHESGGWSWDMRDLEAGLRMAGIEPAQRPLAASHTFRASAAAGMATAGSAVVEGLSEIKDQLYELSPFLAIAKWLLIAVIIASILYTIYTHMDDRRRAAR